MRTRNIYHILIITACVATFSLNEAGAGLPMPPGLPAPPNVNVRIDGYLPAPPGVRVMIDSGRPYYVEREQRVYMQEERPAKHHKKKHYKKEKKHHEEHGNKYGHDKQERHGR